MSYDLGRRWREWRITETRAVRGPFALLFFPICLSLLTVEVQQRIRILTTKSYILKLSAIGGFVCLFIQFAGKVSSRRSPMCNWPAILVTESVGCYMLIQEEKTKILKVFWGSSGRETGVSYSLKPKEQFKWQFPAMKISNVLLSQIKVNTLKKTKYIPQRVF